MSIYMRRLILCIIKKKIIVCIKHRLVPKRIRLCYYPMQILGRIDQFVYHAKFGIKENKSMLLS